MARRILVTGATGAVGGAVMRQLAADHLAGSIELVGSVRSDAAAEALRAQGLLSAFLDFDQIATLRPALRGAEAVFLVGGYSVNMLAHAKRLLNAARAEGVKHIVHLGALAADDTPHAHFVWHQMIEHTIAAMGFSWTHLRPNFFIDTVWNGFRHKPDRLVHFISDKRVSWIAVDDIAAVAAEALRKPEKHSNQLYPLATESLNFRELATLLGEVTGRTVEYRARPVSDMHAILIRQGIEPTYAAGLAEGMAALNAGELPGCNDVFDTVRAVTGRAPITWREFAQTRKAELPAQ